MKLYEFDYDGYGEWWAVMEQDPYAALKAVQRWQIDKGWSESDKAAWAAASVDNLPKGYTLRVFDQGEVIQAENA